MEQEIVDFAKAELWDCSILLINWLKFANSLCLSTGAINGLKSLKENRITDYEFISELLKNWGCETGISSCKVETLCKALREINLNTKADNLQSKWNLLHPPATTSKKLNRRRSLAQNGPIFFGIRVQYSNFCGRSEDLCTLQKYVTENCRCIVINGLPGIGKTTLSKQFALNLYNEKSFHCTLLNGETLGSFRTSVIELITKHKIHTFSDLKLLSELEIFKIISGYLFSEDDSFSWLVILDNVVDKEVEVNIVQPILEHMTSDHEDVKFHCIVTARKLEISKNRSAYIDLKCFSSEDSLILLQKYNKWNESTENLNSLATNLHHFPLSLKQAMSFIYQKRRVSGEGKSYGVVKYLLEYKKEPRKYLDHSDVDNEYKQTTYNTFCVAIKNIKKSKKGGNRAVKLLKILAYINPALKLATIVKLVQSSRKFRNITEEALSLVLEELKNYCLLEMDDNEITIHGLVQEVIRIKYKEEEDDFLLRIIKKTDIESLDSSAMIHFLTVLSHTKESKTVVRAIRQVPAKVLKKMFEIPLFYDAARFYESYFPTMEKFIGKDDNEFTEIKLLNSKIELEIGKPPEQIRADLIDELQKLEILPEKAKFLPEYYKAIGNTCYELKQYNDAILWFEKAIAKFIELNCSQQDIFQLHANLANCLKRLGKFEESIKKTKKVLEWQKANLPGDSVDILRSWHGIGHCLHAQAQEEANTKKLELLREAEGIFFDVLFGYKSLEGFEIGHLRTLPTQFMLGKVSFELNKNNEALEIFKELRKHQIAIYDPSHEEVKKTEEFIVKVEKKLRNPNSPSSSVVDADSLNKIDAEILTTKKDANTMAQMQPENTVGSEKLCFSDNEYHIARNEVGTQTEFTYDEEISNVNVNSVINFLNRISKDMTTLVHKVDIISARLDAIETHLNIL